MATAAAAAGLDLVQTIMTALAGYGAITALQNILGTIFGGGGSSSATDNFSAMITALINMQMMQMMMSTFSNLIPKSSGGLNLGGILAVIGPIIAIVLLIMLLKKKGLF